MSSPDSPPFDKDSWFDKFRRTVFRLVGPKVYWMLRRLMVLIAPFNDSVRSGQLRSAVTGKVVDRAGHPIPWLTYSAIAFLDTLDVAGRNVLEFGSGSSTLWWQDRVESVTAFEADKAWVEQMRTKVAKNVTLIPMPTDPKDRTHKAINLDTFLKEQLGDRLFDIIVIDGADRLGTARSSLKFLAPDGMVVVDNSDTGMNPDGEHAMLDIYREAGLCRVDFYGLGPSIMFPQCTSIAFPAGSWAFRGTQNTAWLKPFNRKTYGYAIGRTNFAAVADDGS